MTVGYDDAARRAVASNGELQVRDADGNVIEEIEFAGSPAHIIVIQERAEVCE